MFFDVCCRKLSLSTNMIEKINGLTTLSNLKILSLARNNIKTFAGLDALAGTLEELWISYNIIEKMKGLLGMNKLKVLYMSNNSVEDWSEVQKLNELESLQDLELVGKELFLNNQQTFYDHYYVILLLRESLVRVHGRVDLAKRMY